MSEPVQNSNVEDVLSSIRRLVSEEDRPAAKAPDPEPSDRLVLTPSLRVAEPAMPDVLVEEDAPETAFEAAPDALCQDDDAPQAEAQGEDGIPHYEVRAEEAFGRAEADAEDAHAGDVEEPEEGQGVFDEGQRVFDAGHEGAADHATASEQDAAADTDAEADIPDEIAAEPEAKPEPDAAASFATPQSLSAKIAALEEVIARRDDQWEPDTAGADAYAGTEDADMAWEDAGADTFEDDPAGPEVFAVDEDVLDEDALRDLVADIVREELQGALGERITRNVRKLVRREIHRALAAQELD
ncbi:MAG: hypothetical protein AAFY38_10765 [Pseudomonadota bacterium]